MRRAVLSVNVAIVGSELVGMSVVYDVQNRSQITIL